MTGVQSCEHVRDKVDAQLSGPTPGDFLERDGRTFWERFRRELNLAIGVPRSLTVAEAIEGCAFAALPFPTSSQAATVRSTQGYFAYKDDDRKLVNGVALTEPGWRYDRKTGFWVVHHLTGQGDDWTGFNIWFGCAFPTGTAVGWSWAVRSRRVRSAASTCL